MHMGFLNPNDPKGTFLFRLQIQLHAMRMTRQLAPADESILISMTQHLKCVSVDVNCTYRVVKCNNDTLILDSVLSTFSAMNPVYATDTRVLWPLRLTRITTTRNLQEQRALLIFLTYPGSPWLISLDKISIHVLNTRATFSLWTFFAAPPFATTIL